MSPLYAYHAIDSTGRHSRGRSEATSPGALTHALERSGHIVFEVDAVDEGTLHNGSRFGRARGVLEFTRACAALLGAGMPAARALSTAALVAPAALAPVIESVRERVERGTALAEALGQHPAFFSPVYAGVVRAGERSGDLTGAFERLTRRLESEQELRSKLISLSTYPILLALAGGAAVIVLVAFVLPRFVDLLTAAGGALPLSTAVLLAISEFVQSYGWIGALVFVATLALGAAASARPAGKRAIARIALNLPLIGTLRRERLSGAFAGMVGVMTAGGSPLLRALDDTADCVADPLARDEVTRIRSRVREGASLRQAISEGGFFPPLLERLVAVGEESARLPDFLLEAATLFERRTQRMLERMVALVEPLMILMFGGIVAFIALALLQGIYGINAGTFR